MAVHEHRGTSPASVSFSIVTVSDSRNADTDSSGKLIESMAASKGHRVVSRVVVKDDAAEILASLRNCVEGDSDIIVFTGGTGITSRDVTPETIRPRMDKVIDGFGELFRHLSYMSIGGASIMSRSFAGVISGKLVFCLPGSPDAAKLAMESIILPEAGHLVRETRR